MGFAVFGFGSIIFRPNFEYTRRFDGYVRDWVRVFWQGSTGTRRLPLRRWLSLLAEHPPVSPTGVVIEHTSSHLCHCRSPGRARRPRPYGNARFVPRWRLLGHVLRCGSLRGARGGDPRRARVAREAV